MNKRTIIVGLLLIFLLVLSACSTRYVCYDGTTERREERCPVLPTASVIERDARTYADNYGNSFALSKGVRYQRVNLYREGTDYFSIVLFSDQRTQEVHEVKLKIDGRTGSVSCIEGCSYLRPDGTEEDQ